MGSGWSRTQSLNDLPPATLLPMNKHRLAALLLPLAVATVTTLRTGDHRRDAQEPEAKRAAPAAQEPSGDEKKVRELLEVTNYRAIAKQAMDQMMDAIGKLPGLPDGFAERFMEQAKVEDLVELQVPIYLKHVASKDLDAILAFMRTDAGKRWNAAQPAIMKDGMAAGQEWGRKLGAKVGAELAEKK